MEDVVELIAPVCLPDIEEPASAGKLGECLLQFGGYVPALRQARAPGYVGVGADPLHRCRARKPLQEECRLFLGHADYADRGDIGKGPSTQIVDGSLV